VVVFRAVHLYKPTMVICPVQAYHRLAPTMSRIVQVPPVVALNIKITNGSVMFQIK
jgi:hypothetical protein